MRPIGRRCHSRHRGKEWLVTTRITGDNYMLWCFECGAVRFHIDNQLDKRWTYPVGAHGQNPERSN